MSQPGLIWQADCNHIYWQIELGIVRLYLQLFNQSCAMCHYPDQAETKVGPGLKGLYKKDQMSISGWKVTDDNVRRQLKTPYANMPPFPDMTEEEMQALIAYLHAL